MLIHPQASQRGRRKTGSPLQGGNVQQDIPDVAGAGAPTAATVSALLPGLRAELTRLVAIPSILFARLPGAASPAP
jgi:hypothetical protein